MQPSLLLCAEFLLAKRIHIGVLAFISVIYAMRCLGVGLSGVVIPFISALVVWSAYLENLTTDAKEDQLNVNAPHGMSVKVEARLVNIEKAYPVLYCVALALAYTIGYSYFLATLLCVIVFCSYVQRVFPVGRGKWIRLKEVYIIKNLIPPLGWVLAVLVMPVVASGKGGQLEYGLFVLIFFIFSFREEIKFDIPDAKGDLAAGIRTFPNVLGSAATRNILRSINVILLILLCLFVLFLWETHRWGQLGDLLKNIMPLLLAFAYDHNFTNVLFETERKEYCNIGIIWWVASLFFFLIIPYPYNIFVYIFIRLAGNYTGQSVLARWLRFVQVKTRTLAA